MADQQQQPEEKQYSLKAAETNLLRYVKQHTEAIFAGILSTIAADRLAYTVTPNTKFELTNDFTMMKLSEMQPPAAPAEQPAAPQNVPGEPKKDEGSPVVSAPEAPKAAEAPAAPQPEQPAPEQSKQ